MIFNRLVQQFKKNIRSFLKEDEVNETIIFEKEEIRKEIKILKQKLTEEEKKTAAETVFRKIESQPEFINAKTILLYWSMPDELPTHDFIKKWGHYKSILLPVVKGHHMTIRPYSSEDGLIQGNWNVMEPMTGKDYLKRVDLVIVPGVAFDRKKRRLGRGKGYYDRYFKNKKMEKWGICYDFQMYDNIPVASFDIKMNKIFTPSEIIQ
ncbi:MAG: 5-formyltetrahydrofolate cyclo-ligase [Paludibacter sp.]|nr:5-formyltetrahydrofolate cyclo-ligase [Paludibacter sp.]